MLFPGGSVQSLGTNNAGKASGFGQMIKTGFAVSHY